MDFPLSPATFAIVLPFVFLAGLVDSIAGGGGLLSLPAYLAAGLPPHFALGNNKFSSCFGTLFAALRYWHRQLMDVPVALLGAAGALAGSYAGARAVLLIDPGFLNWLLVILIPGITLFTFLKPDLGREARHDEVPVGRRRFLGTLAGLLIGFYDGFFGPGTGSFLIFFYTLALRYDLVTANANTKAVNLASNIAALIGFLAGGKVIFALGVPAAAAGIAGNLLGAHLVLRSGARLIRPILLLGLTALFIKILINLFR
jgi:uncharacterized membrane protein YfcA